MIVKTEDMLLFWQPDNVFSNWCLNTPFRMHKIDKTILWDNSEAAFMYLKALHFGDYVIAETIRTLQQPSYVKKQGRRVNSFNEEEWAKVRFKIMSYVVREKFLQNPMAFKELLQTGNRIIVEASPYDKVWGIGIAPDDPKALNPKNWQGMNLLGEILMNLRDEYIN